MKSLHVVSSNSSREHKTGWQFKRSVVVVLLVLLSYSLVAVPAHAAVYWYSLGGKTLSSPGLAGEDYTGTARPHVVVRGTDNALYHKYYVGSLIGWKGWLKLGGATYFQPAVAVTKGAVPPQSSYLHVVVVGVDLALYSKRFNLASETWDAAWTKLGGKTPSAPSLVSYSGATGEFLYLFVRGTDNAIYYRVWSSSTGQWLPGWSKIPTGATIDPPAVAVLGDYLHVVVTGTDWRIYHIRGIAGVHVGQTWDTSWTRLSDTKMSHPVLEAITEPYDEFARWTLYLFAVGLDDNKVYYNYYVRSFPCDGGPGICVEGWMKDPFGVLDGLLTIDRPGAVWEHQGSVYSKLFVYVRNGAANMIVNGVYEQSLDLYTGIWSGWTYMNGKTILAVTAELVSPESAYVAVRGMDDQTYLTW